MITLNKKKKPDKREDTYDFIYIKKINKTKSLLL